ARPGRQRLTEQSADAVSVEPAERPGGAHQSHRDHSTRRRVSGWISGRLLEGSETDCRAVAGGSSLHTSDEISAAQAARVGVAKSARSGETVGRGDLS